MTAAQPPALKALTAEMMVGALSCVACFTAFSVWPSRRSCTAWRRWLFRASTVSWLPLKGGFLCVKHLTLLAMLNHSIE
ncbi:hypothetical protein D9M69_682780 [compost metagenome]